MTFTITITPRKIHLFIVIILVIWFFYMVPLNNGLRVPFPSGTTELYEQVGGEAALVLMHENPVFIATEAMIAVFHQYAVKWGGPIHQKWLWATMIITMSGFLWATVISFVSVPKGFRLKEGNLVQHMAFSAVLAAVSLLQILQSLRSDPEDFYWVPWFIIVFAALAFRAYRRIRGGKRTVLQEIIFHIPWAVGLAVPHLIWFEPFRGMNYGASIYLPLSEYYVNAYTIIMNLAIIVVSLGFLFAILSEKKKEVVS